MDVRHAASFLGELQEAKLREIGPRLAGLSGAQRRAVSAEVCRRLDGIVCGKGLSPEHRWLITALQFLAPPEAGELAARVTEEAIGLKGCCGCTLNRSIRVLGAIRPVSGIPALVSVIGRAERPRHKHLAAACVEKIAGSRGAEAEAALAAERPRVRAALRRLRRAVARASPVRPARPWEQPAGSPGWFAAAARAEKAMARLLQRGKE